MFRHWPRLGSPAGQYEEDLAAFHQALAEAGVAGFQGSIVFRLDHAPWLPAGRTGYEDWHLLDAAGCLDALNEAAVSAERRAPHDRVAAAAQSGLGALYGLARGNSRTQALTQTRSALWLSKPRGVSYDAFYSRVTPLLEPEGSLWRRQMVLGPPPEFGLLRREPLAEIGGDMRPIALELTAIWP